MLYNFYLCAKHFLLLVHEIKNYIQFLSETSFEVYNWSDFSSSKSVLDIKKKFLELYFKY